MNKVIGIISYLPDDKIVRKVRIEKITTLIRKCDELFNLPIIIVAQNWKDDKIGSPNCEIYDYDKLGIVGARKELRRLFLNSCADVLIMLDDDCNLIGTKESADYYLKEIDNHNIAFGEFRGTQLKLFSIHRDILKEVDYRNVNPELGEGFEDTVFVELLRRVYPDKRFEFHRNTSLNENSVAACDEYSTWYSTQNLTEMLEKTKRIKEKL